jgi:peptidoglycan/LPS O-acetylase OafA/YrhL
MFVLRDPGVPSSVVQKSVFRHVTILKADRRAQTDAQTERRAWESVAAAQSFTSQCQRRRGRMRQVADTLAWLGMIVVVAAVIYFTPRLANYVNASTATAHGAACARCRELACQQQEAADASR